MQQLSIICAPFQCGCDRDGGQMAPEWLVRNGIRAVSDDVRRQESTRMPEESLLEDGVKNLSKVMAQVSVLRDVVARLMADGKRVLTIGGDHSVALGSIAGVLEQDPNVGVIWFDAHGDINTEATSPSANAHGMPVAALMGLCESGLNEIACVRLKPKNIFWIGARDLDVGEKKTIERLGIADNVYSTERVHAIGMAAVMEDIRRKMMVQGIEAVHLSFDIDGMDPSIVWATGTRVENGLKQEDLETFVEGLRRLPEMKSMDFVEYNPLMDDEEKRTGKWCVNTIKMLVNI